MKIDVAAIKYVEKLKAIEPKAFDEACGVGVVISPKQIEKAVKDIIAKKKDDLDKKRYQIVGMLLGQVKASLKWANPILVKEELDTQMFAYLGPKDERDDPKAMVPQFHVEEKRKTEQCSGF
jgi:glutaminyl-tRNA synthetase